MEYPIKSKKHGTVPSPLLWKAQASNAQGRQSLCSCPSGSDSRDSTTACFKVYYQNQMVSSKKTLICFNMFSWVKGLRTNFQVNMGLKNHLPSPLANQGSRCHSAPSGKYPKGSEDTNLIETLINQIAFNFLFCRLRTLTLTNLK